MKRLFLIYAHYRPNAVPCCYEVFADSRKQAREIFHKGIPWLDVKYVVPTHITADASIEMMVVSTRRKRYENNSCFYGMSFKEQEKHCRTCDKAELCINHCHGCKHEIFGGVSCAKCNRLYGRDEYIYEPWWLDKQGGASQDGT